KTTLDRSPHTMRALRSRLTGFARSFKDRPLGSIRRGEVLAYVVEMPLAPKTIWNYKNDLGNFFNWCVRREWIPANPLALVGEDDLPRVVRKSVGLLSVEDSTRLMRTAEGNDRYRPYLPCLA